VPPFSSRLRWDLPRNRLTLLAEERWRRGEEVLDLTESNPTRVGLPYPAADILAALSDPRTLTYEPSPRGLPEARAAVAERLSRLGVPADPERLLLTASTSEAYAFLFNLLLDPGEEVLVPHPSYPLLDLLASLESVRLRPYALAYEGRWSLDLDSLRRATTAATRAVVVVHPNNPTGCFLRREEADGLRAWCRERGLAIISDEVFRDYALAPDADRLPTLAGVEDVLTFCLDGLSKSAGLPQMKLGWIWLAGPPGLRREALERLELVADSFLSVGSPVQHAARRLLQIGDRMRGLILERLRANLDLLRAAVARAPSCTLLEPEGGWTAVLRLPATRSDEDWALELLREEGVRVHPGYFYDFTQEAVLILSLLPEPGIFREGVARVMARAS
jgi:aspartate/methionine/tyrosine aminotransferase